jgi:hypothetical protein
MQLRSKGKEPFCEEDPDPGPCRMEVSYVPMAWTVIACISRRQKYTVRTL